MMVKEVLVPGMAETLIGRENSSDGLKAKSSIHSLPTSENNLVKNGGAKIPTGRSGANLTFVPKARPFLKRNTIV